jgi:arylsulfatase A-like enzyme
MQLNLLRAILCALCISAVQIQAAGPAKPNILLILADDLGWSDTTLYGHTKLYQTPNIERLARRGMTFTRAYSASPLCSPTRSANLTGLSPARTGITTPNCHLPKVVLQATPGKSAPPNQHAIQPDPVTRLDPKKYAASLPQTLKAAGYATAHFGKWHLGAEPYSPLQHGFDVDIPHHPGPGPAGSYVAPWKFPSFKEKSPGEHLEDRMAAEAVAWMERNKDRPFFLNYWQFSVHAPFDAKKALIEKHRARIDPNDAQRSPTYAAMIESLDDAVGTLLEALDRLGLAEKTIIIFTSDNGGNMYSEVDGTVPTSNRPLRGGKATMFEGGVRVPQIIVWPGITVPGSRSDALTQSEDLFPTLLEGLGLKPAAGQRFDGASILPALRGDSLTGKAVFQYFPHAPGVPDWLPPSVSVHRDDWKLIRIFHAGDKGAHRYQLYNLRDDPGEKNNLAAQRPELVRELDALIETFLADTKAVVPVPNPAFDPAKYRRELEGVQTNKKKQQKKKSPAAPTASASQRPSQVFAGGVAGIEDLLTPAHSQQFRAAGGGLYLHNNGWAALSVPQQRELLRLFADRPVAIELGFRPSPEAWATRYRTGYAALGITPDFICANAFDSNHRPTLDAWRRYTETLRKEGGVPDRTRILPTFEYANFGPNIPLIATTKVSQTPEFQQLIQAAGGLALDVPSGYFFKREQNYRDWVIDALRWTHAAGLRSVLIVSPHDSGRDFDRDARRQVAYLRKQDALPDVFVCENYAAGAAADYPNRLGQETVPHHILGVALALGALRDNPDAFTAAGWAASNDAFVVADEERLHLTALGRDPWISTRDLPASSRGPFTVKLRMKSTGSGPGVLYFNPKRADAFHKDRTVTFSLAHDRAEHDYEIKIPAETLAALRLDPGNAPGEIVITHFTLNDARGTLVKSFTPDRKTP